MDLRQDVLHTMLDGLSELIYVCDMETHRLLYLNEEGRRLYGVDAVGGERLCYQVLQGRDEPCPFCTNDRLSGESFFEWEFTNPVSRRHYLLRDRLVDWDGRPARLEIAFDMTERQRESESFKFLANAGSMVVDCIRVLEGGSTLEIALNDALCILGTFLEADRAYVFKREGDRMSNTHEWCGLGVAPQRRFLQDLPVSLIDEWVKRFDAGEAVIIEDVDQLPSLGRAAEYEVLKSQDIASLVAAPIEIDGTFAGYLGVDNPRRVGELGVVKSPLVAFASFVSARMKREIAQRQVAELTWNDSLTCAHSRAAFHRDFDRGTFGRIGFVLVDADRLAVVNREQGHSAGDEMLCRIASCLREVFGDAVYRIGDDEFCAVSTSVDYNRFAREFDIVTLDRVKRMDIEPDLNIWKEYAYAKGLHASVISYLNLKKEHFYHIENTAAGVSFVTARGWEDLSSILFGYEELGLTPDEKLIRQYIQDDDIARDFAAYYQLYAKYRKDYPITELLAGNLSEKEFQSVCGMASSAPSDEQLSVCSLLLDGWNRYFLLFEKEDHFVIRLQETLSQAKAALLADSSLTDFAEQYRKALKNPPAESAS